MISKFYTRFAVVFTSILMFTFIASSQTTISIQVSDPSDDHEEAAEATGSVPIGTMDKESSDLEFINEEVLQFVGMIFRNVQIPPNANITNAYIQLTSDKALAGPVTCRLYGAAEANVTAPFTEDLFSISSHTHTTATVSWTIPPWGAFGEATEAQRTPDISAIIEEIVAISGWASGNNLMIGATGDSLGKIDNREAVSYEGNPIMAPILNVTFNTNPLGVNPDRAEFSNSIYPNPTQGILSIENPSSDKFSYEIYTISGKLVASMNNIAGPTTQVDLSSFAKGVYFVNVRNADTTKTHKLILK